MPRFVSGLLFHDPLFSTISVALFLALFFPQVRVFNNFSALFFGLFRFVFGGRTCVINNFSALFFKKGILFCFSPLEPAAHRHKARLPY
jgi:hypothetical protein